MEEKVRIIDINDYYRICVTTEKEWIEYRPTNLEDWKESVDPFQQNLFLRIFQAGIMCGQGISNNRVVVEYTIRYEGI